MNKNLSPVALLALSFLLSPSAFSWGERGHDGVTRVATRILADNKDMETAKFGAFLQKKENMLAHLANVPDIVWRSVSPDLDRISSPAHFIDLEFILGPGPLPSVDKMPIDITAYLKALDKNCDKRSIEYPCVNGQTVEEKLQKAGHAPFRIETLSQDLVEAYRELKTLQVKDESGQGKDGNAKSESESMTKKNAVVDRILLLSGVLSHYVGDLSNPHHTSKDYDGWESGQGGLHGYFETDLVDSLGLELEADVLDEAERHEPMAERFANHPHNFLAQSWELVLDSHEKLGQLSSLDLQNALLLKSQDNADTGKNLGSDNKGHREKAKRKDPRETRSKFRNLIIMRLAAGADALSRIWLDTWQQGGKPDLSFYRSYHYDVQPGFIPMRYLPAK